ncbi:MAG: outer membrane protein assembly factor BamC [Methylophilaceae bacterium]|nr:outer membrane protein assembly factor BamC [Methylophilaceae bacterium]
MNKKQIKPIILVSLLALIVSGCDSIPFMNNTPDYKGAGRARPLEVPPDLTSISSNDTYTVPGGSTTYSEFSQGQDGPAEKEKILPTPESVHLVRAGSQRWLVVQAPPEKIWPVIREFWAELGFAVRIENTDTGVMETEWVDPSSLTKDDKGNYLDKFQGWLDRLNTLANRQKFRTRLDRGESEGTTEIYMSHRAVSDTPDDGKVKVRNNLGEFDTGYVPQNQARTIAEKARADAEDLDAELLRRLMVRLGVEDQKSRSIMANSPTQLRASLNKATDGAITLAVNDEFDRAWRRVGLALDRVGFVVEDKNRSNGVYFVRYTDVDIDTAPKKKKGLLDNLKFWGDDKEEKKPEPVVEAKKEDSSITDKLKFWKPAEKTTVDPSKQYRVKVEENGEAGSKVTIVDKEGNINKSSTANVIINLLYEQLK